MRDEPPLSCGNISRRSPSRWSSYPSFRFFTAFIAAFTLWTLLCYIYLSLCSLKTFEAIHISQVTCITWRFLVQKMRANILPHLRNQFKGACSAMKFIYQVLKQALYQRPWQSSILSATIFSLGFLQIGGETGHKVRGKVTVHVLQLNYLLTMYVRAGCVSREDWIR